MGKGKFKISIHLIIVITYIRNIKENIKILFTRKGKIIGGKFIFFNQFKFWKSGHELAEIKLIENDIHRINLTFLLGNGWMMWLLWQSSSLNFDAKPSHIKIVSLEKHEDILNELSWSSSIYFTLGENKYVSNRHQLPRHNKMVKIKQYSFFLFLIIKFVSW